MSELKQTYKAPMGRCSVCGEMKRLTSAGMVYKHMSMFQTVVCPGSQQPKGEIYYPETSERTPTGLTDDDMHQMLEDLTPRRQKLRERLSARWAQFKLNLFGS